MDKLFKVSKINNTKDVDSIKLCNQASVINITSEVMNFFKQLRLSVEVLTDNSDNTIIDITMFVYAVCFH